MSGTKTVAVIGAGPVGLAAAAYLMERGQTPIVLEAGAEIGAVGCQGILSRRYGRSAQEPLKLQATQALAVTNSSRRKTPIIKKSNARVANRTDASDFSQPYLGQAGARRLSTAAPDHGGSWG
jgi:flavin-dependent dehydrogenase